jgi:hypothetical protein
MATRFLLGFLLVAVFYKTQAQPINPPNPFQFPAKRLEEPPSYFSFRERLTVGGTSTGMPIRDAVLALKVSIVEGPRNNVVFEEDHATVKTDYDGFISIKVGVNDPTKFNSINWQNGSKKIRVESRTQGRLQLTYEDWLPAAAYAQYARPSDYKKTSGTIKMFSDINHPNIELVATNGTSSNFPYIDFSAGNEDYRARIKTIGNDLGLESKGVINFESNAGKFRFGNNNSFIEVQTSGSSPGISFSSSPNNPGAYFKLNNQLLEISGPSSGVKIIGSAGLTVDGGPIIGSAGLTVEKGDLNVNTGAIKVNGTTNGGGEYNYFAKNSRIRYYNTLGNNVTDGGSSIGTVADTGQYYSVIASGRVAAQEFNAYSDARIKKFHGNVSSQSSLDIISKLKVNNYSYVDIIQYGESTKTGFFAQEVESVLPEAITKTKDIVPDIFQPGKSVHYDSMSGLLAITLDSIRGLKTGDFIKIIGEKAHTVEVAAVLDGEIRVKDWPEKDTKQVFVYGRQVDDFRVVDYDHIFTMNVSATQALIQEMKGLKAELKELRDLNKGLESENNSLKKVLTVLESRVGSIEKQLFPSTNASTGTH